MHNISKIPYICPVINLRNLIKLFINLKQKYMLSACLAMLAIAGQADTGETVMVNGSVVEGFVTKITFDGDNAVMLFADGKTQAADMSQVNIELSYDGGDVAIKDVTAAQGKVDGRIYTIGGQYAGDSPDGLSKGIYIVNGKKIVIK